MNKILFSIFVFFVSSQLLASDLSNYNNNAICHLAIKNNHWETKPNLLKFVEEAQRRGISCGISKYNNSEKKNYSKILGENFKSFNKFSKIKVKINDKTIESVIAYKEKENLFSRNAEAKIVLFNELCDANVQIKDKSSFNLVCNSGYKASGFYHPTKNAINAVGKGTDSNNNIILFRMFGDGSSSREDFLKIVNDNLVNKLNKDKIIKLWLLDKLKKDIEIKSENFVINVVKQKIYLSGFAQSKNEMSKVLHWATKARFVNEIINYIEVTKHNNSKKRHKTINPSISSAELEKERIKRLEEERKRKALEQRIAELEKKNKELLKSKKVKQKPSNEIGSGFYVSKFRHIITNQHVVNNCKKITVGNSINTQIQADLIATDKRNDLAILQTVSMEMASNDTKSFVQKLAIQIVPVLSGGLMRSEDVTGGEQIYVAGYPLGNMVSDQVKLVDGIVSATKGMDNDVSQFIISSDIKKGNSGGPVYDNKGNIVGIAVSRLNVNRTDTINFAIKGSTVKQFLSAHNVPTKWSNRQYNIDTKDLYKIASKQTVMVVCHG